MHNSVNRKGVNFKPFDALEGYKEALERTKIESFKEDKIILSSDEEEEINEVITYAIRENKFVLIKYYDNGFYKLVSGYIKCIDSVHLRIDDLRISLKDIVCANII